MSEERAKYTPGPWVAIFPERDYGFKVETLSREYPFDHRQWQEVCRFSASNGFEEANARLIAAAPSLYEALKEASALYHNAAHIRRGGFLDCDDSTCKSYRAALDMVGEAA